MHQGTFLDFCAITFRADRPHEHHAFLTFTGRANYISLCICNTLSIGAGVVAVTYLDMGNDDTYRPTVVRPSAGLSYIPYGRSGLPLLSEEHL